MEKILNNYGGAILLYLVIFIGIIAINNKFVQKIPQNSIESDSIALND